MRMYDILLKKRDGGCLTKQEIDFLISGATDGTIPDYQLSAFAMAVFFQGMTEEETSLLTDAMARSGDMLDLSAFGDRSVDKHSTGGVGDKTTLIVAPIVASLGGKIAKMSGRGLGHTGGTVDKLESIPGYRTELSNEEFLSQVEKTGLAVIGQTGNLAPADKKLYALRDVTATVDSIPLICSSIMSKKLAAGSHSIVLDVKVGSGAFMKTFADAKRLSKTMVAIAKACGRNAAAVITNMDVPLGSAVGNGLEVEEALSVLKGETAGDLLRVSLELAANMLCLCNGWEPEYARQQAKNALQSGKALDKFKEWIQAQGGRMDFDSQAPLPQAKYRFSVKAPQNGYIQHMDAQQIGIASVLLGAGRSQKDDPVDHTAGIRLLRKTGDYVRQGEELGILYRSSQNLFSEAEKQFLKALSFGETEPSLPPEIYGIIR